MFTAQKVVNVTSLLISLMLLYCLIGFKLGYDGLFLVGNIELLYLVRVLLKDFLFGIQTLLFYSFILNDYSIRSVLKVTLPYLAIHCIITLFYTSPFMAWVAPQLYVMGIALWRRGFKGSLARAVLVILIVAGYEALAIMLKVGLEKLGYNSLSMYEWLVMSIDLLIVSILVYAKGGVEYYARLAVRQQRRRPAWELVLFPGSVCNASHSDEGSNEATFYSSLSNFERLVAMSSLLLVQLVQWALILFICKLGNVFIEGLVITASFVAHGFIIQRRWHAKKLVVCTLSSASLFYISAKLSVAFYYSQLFPILVGLALVYTLYRFSIYLDNLAINKSQKELERLKKIEHSMQIAWEQIDDLM